MQSGARLEKENCWVQGNRIQILSLKGIFKERVGHMHRFGGRYRFQLNEPGACMMDMKGNLIIADSGNHRLVTYQGKDEKKYRTIQPLKLNYPRGLYQDKSGDIYVSDTHNHRIIILSEDFTPRTYVGKLGSGRGEFSQPQGIFVRKNRIYVCDRMNHRVQVLLMKYKDS